MDPKNARVTCISYGKEGLLFSLAGIEILHFARHFSGSYLILLLRHTV